MDPAEFELLRYIARQSVLSATSRPVSLLQPPLLTSPFQQRMVNGDFDSNLTQELRDLPEPPDLLIIDLADERLGVHLLPDGSVITRTPELIASGVERSLPPMTRHIPFGSEEHLSMWQPAIRRLGDGLRALGPARLVVLDIPWALRSTTGVRTPTSFGMTASEMNPTMSAYAEATAEEFGGEVVSLDPQRVLSSPSHPWGDAPFHYSEHVYLDIVLRLTNRLGRSIWG